MSKRNKHEKNPKTEEPTQGTTTPEVEQETEQEQDQTPAVEATTQEPQALVQEEPAKEQPVKEEPVRNPATSVVEKKTGFDFDDDAKWDKEGTKAKAAELLQANPEAAKELLGLAGGDVPPIGLVDAKLLIAANSPNANMVSIAKLICEYRNNNMSSMPASKDNVIRQINGLWLAIRLAVTEPDLFRECMTLVMDVFRENRGNAFGPQALMRYIGFPGTTMSAEHVQSYTNMVTLLTAAAEVNRISDVSKLVDLGRCLDDSVFTEEQVQRLKGYFAA